MASHSSTLAWKIPWIEEPGRLQSKGSRRVGHDWATSPSLFTFLHWRRKWQPTPVLLPGESQGWGSLVAALYGVAQSRTRLKRLSSSSSSKDLSYSSSCHLVIQNSHKWKYEETHRIQTSWRQKTQWCRIYSQSCLTYFNYFFPLILG